MNGKIMQTHSQFLTTPVRPASKGAGLQPARVTWSLCLAAIIIGCVPCLGAALQLDRAATGGQWWRAYTAHLAHWNTDHLFWDVLMFAVLGTLCERHGRRQFVVCLVAAATAISAAVWWLEPAMSRYRGLSGIDSALFTMTAVAMLKQAWPGRDYPILAAGSAAIVAFAVKVIYEVATGDTLFVDSAAAGFVPLPSSHLVGGCVGTATALFTASARESAALRPPSADRRCSE